MMGSEFQEIHRYLSELAERIEKIEKQLELLPCLCKGDFTDGTAYCEQCGRERRSI